MSKTEAVIERKEQKTERRRQVRCTLQTPKSKEVAVCKLPEGKRVIPQPSLKPKEAKLVKIFLESARTITPTPRTTHFEEVSEVEPPKYKFRFTSPKFSEAPSKGIEYEEAIRIKLTSVRIAKAEAKATKEEKARTEISVRQPSIYKEEVKELEEVLTAQPHIKLLESELILERERISIPCIKEPTIEEVKSTFEIQEKRIGEVPEIEETLPKLPFKGDLGLPADTQLFYLVGKEGMGFRVFRGLLELELMDRGRRPKMYEIIFDKDIKGKIKTIEDLAPLVGKLTKISDDYYDYYKLVWVENCPVKSLVEEPKIAAEIDKALTKRVMKYIVFSEPVKEKEPVPLYLKTFEEAFSKFRSFKAVVLETLDLTPDSLRELGKVFAGILNINKRDIALDGVIERLGKKPKIDDLWVRLSHEEGSAIRSLLKIYENDPEVRRYCPLSKKSENESDEHWLMKLFMVKQLLEMGRVEKVEPKHWEVEIPRGEGEVSTEIEVEYPTKDEKGAERKVPDITATIQGKRIWVEIETCKHLGNPLDFVLKKLRKITEIDAYEQPDELWIVFPYRKYFIYGKSRFNEVIRSYFETYRRKFKTHKLKPRIFFIDFYDERLVELRD